MKVVSAKVLDKRHLELMQPIFEHPGESIQIFIPGKDEESRLWRKAAKEHFLKSYGISDAIYDKL